jgi:hypothetical protein
VHAERRALSRSRSDVDEALVLLDRGGMTGTDPEPIDHLARIHDESFRRLFGALHSGMPRVVQRFLDCGLLENGFVEAPPLLPARSSPASVSSAASPTIRCGISCARHSGTRMSFPASSRLSGPSARSSTAGAPPPSRHRRRVPQGRHVRAAVVPRSGAPVRGLPPRRPCRVRDARAPSPGSRGRHARLAALGIPRPPPREDRHRRREGSRTSPATPPALPSRSPASPTTPTPTWSPWLPTSSKDPPPAPTGSTRSSFWPGSSPTFRGLARSTSATTEPTP